MSIGQAYRDLLTPHEQQALQEACDWLIDSVFDECERVRSPQELVKTTLGGYLPRRFLLRYTPLFFRQFAVCLITVAWKMGQATALRLGSVAEELAAWALIEQAKTLLQEKHGEEDAEGAFDAFIDGYFEDTDVLTLFDDALDGFDETPVAQMMGVSSLAFDDWFLPFTDSASQAVHPYVLDAE